MKRTSYTVNAVDRREAVRNARTLAGESAVSVLRASELVYGTWRVVLVVSPENVRREVAG